MIFEIPGHEELRKELNKNHRLRLGFGSILCLLCIWLSLVWSDVNQAQYKSVRSLSQQKASLKETEAVTVWQRRYDLELQRRQALTQQLWKAESNSLAVAKFRSVLTEIASAGGSYSINVGTPQSVENLEGVSKVRARVGMNLPPDQLLSALVAIDESAQLLTIDELSIRRSKENWSTEIFLSANFVIGK